MQNANVLTVKVKTKKKQLEEEVEEIKQQEEKLEIKEKNEYLNRRKDLEEEKSRNSGPIPKS